jgi:hypothetical protein
MRQPQPGGLRGDLGDRPVRQRPGHRQRGIGIGIDQGLALVFRSFAVLPGPQVVATRRGWRGP